MTDQADATFRKIIDQTVEPRITDYHTYLANAAADPLPVARAELLYLWDEYRTEYLDWASLNNPVGHFHPIVVQKVDEHRRYYNHTSSSGDHAQRWPVQYAKDLSAQFTGKGEVPRQVLFTEGEREAVLQAIKIASPSASPVVATIGGGYDWIPGRRIWYPADFFPEEVSWDVIDALLISPADRNAVVMSPALFHRWIKTARKHDVTVIVDETVSGFGRLGTMWGQQGFNSVVDITVLGGAVGGGYPLGAVIAPPELFQRRRLDVSSQAANPIACCAGAGTLTAVGIGTLEYMAETDKVLTDGLEQLCKQFPGHLGGHCGVGHLRGLWMSGHERSSFTANCLVDAARGQGLYLAPPAGNTVVLAPVLITSANELSRGLDILASVLMDWDDE